MLIYCNSVDQFADIAMIDLEFSPSCLLVLN